MEAKKLHIVYMGTPDFAVTPLRALVEGGYNVVSVVTTPDKPAGRGLKIQESAVKKYAVEAGLHIMQPEKLKAPDFIEEFRSLGADLAIVIAFRMLPEVIWNMPPMGTFNLHASLLPQYRGAAPINWAIINGETQTGVTTFMLNHEIDKGDILCRSEIAITSDDNVETLHDKLMSLGTSLVLETVEKIATGNVTALPQRECNDIKDAPKIFKETCRIDWNSNGSTIGNLIRGLSPYPTAWSIIQPNDLQVKIYAGKAESSNHTYPAGTILSDNKTYIKVACADGYYSVSELQIAGKKRMSSEELLRGFKNITDYRFQ